MSSARSHSWMSSLMRGNSPLKTTSPVTATDSEGSQTKLSPLEVAGPTYVTRASTPPRSSECVSSNATSATSSSSSARLLCVTTFAWPNAPLPPIWSRSPWVLMTYVTGRPPISSALSRTGSTSSVETIVSMIKVASLPTPMVLLDSARSPWTGPRATVTRSVTPSNRAGLSPPSGGVAMPVRLAPDHDGRCVAAGYHRAMPQPAVPASPFVGRDAELAALLACWEAVKGGEGPRAVALLAESGLGKTRLVQELYAALVQREQGGVGYWPSGLRRERDDLKVNPGLDECDLNAQLPFLWWALRLTNPG